MVDVVGPVCETGDFLAKDRDMPWSNPANCSRSVPPAPMALRSLQTITPVLAPPKCSLRMEWRVIRVA